MIIGVPKEIKNNENRVGMTPSGVAEIVKRGHTVYIQHTAGINSGFPDAAYTAVGAQILPTMEEVYAIAEMIVKVKEPIAPEYKLIRKGQILSPSLRSAIPFSGVIPKRRESLHWEAEFRLNNAIVPNLCRR